MPATQASDAHDEAEAAGAQTTGSALYSVRIGLPHLAVGTQHPPVRSSRNVEQFVPQCVRAKGRGREAVHVVVEGHAIHVTEVKWMMACLQGSSTN